MHRHRHDPLKNLVGFVVGDVHYALPILHVREISNPLEVVALPHPPPGVCGVSDYRGEVVPVIDLRERFGLEVVPNTRRTKWIIVDVGNRRAAVVVDAVSEVFGSVNAALRPAPLLGGGEDMRGIIGVTQLNEKMVFVLDVERLREWTESLVANRALGAAASRSLPPKEMS